MHLEMSQLDLSKVECEVLWLRQSDVTKFNMYAALKQSACRKM